MSNSAAFSDRPHFDGDQQGHICSKKRIDQARSILFLVGQGKPANQIAVSAFFNENRFLLVVRNFRKKASQTKDTSPCLSLFLLCRAEEGCADSCIDEIGNQRTEAYVGKEVVSHVDAVVAV